MLAVLNLTFEIEFGSLHCIYCQKKKKEACAYMCMLRYEKRKIRKEIVAWLLYPCSVILGPNLFAFGKCSRVSFDCFGWAISCLPGWCQPLGFGTRWSLKVHSIILWFCDSHLCAATQDHFSGHFWAESLLTGNLPEKFLKGGVNIFWCSDQESMIFNLDGHPKGPSSSKVVWVLSPFCKFLCSLSFPAHWQFQTLHCARTLIDSNRFPSYSFSGVLVARNVRAQTSTIRCHYASASSHHQGIIATQQELQESSTASWQDRQIFLIVSEHHFNSFKSVRADTGPYLSSNPKGLSLHFNVQFECVQFTGTVYF